MSQADWVKIALCNIYKAIIKENLPVKLRMTIHDEIVCSTTPEYAEEWKERQERLMIEAGQTFISSIPLKADSKIARYWTK